MITQTISPYRIIEKLGGGSASFSEGIVQMIFGPVQTALVILALFIHAFLGNG